MIDIVGKYTVKIFDRSGSLVDERESYNTITNLGRQRVLDIWSMNYGPTDTMHRSVYGVEEYDLNPAAVTGGTRRCTMFGAGVMHSTDNVSSYDYSAYDSYVIGTGGTQTLSDNIFINSNGQAAYWDLGPGGNQDPRSYKHSIDMARIDTTETVTVNYSGANYLFQLIGTNIKYDYNSNQRNALKVTNTAATVTYSIGTDYTYNRLTGVITFIYGGAIANGQAVNVSYKWHQPNFFADGIIGMYMRAWTRPDYDYMFDNTVLGQGRYSVDCGENWTQRCMPWMGLPLQERYSQSVNDYDHAGDHYTSNIEHVDWRHGSQYDHYYFTYPYIINKPTNLEFNGSFGFGPIWISNWKFFKPRYQPQTPQCMALGTGNTAAEASDTALQSEVVRLKLLSGVRPSNGMARWNAYMDFDQGAGVAFKEVGLFHGDEWRYTTAAGWTHFAPIYINNCNSLFSRSVYGSSWTKTADQRVELTYDLLLT